MLYHVTRFSALTALGSAMLLGQTVPVFSSSGPNPAISESGSKPESQKPAIPDLDGRPKISDKTRMQIIQVINAEFVRTRKTLPVGFKGIALTSEGEIKPSDARLYQLAL